MKLQVQELNVLVLSNSPCGLGLFSAALILAF